MAFIKIGSPFFLFLDTSLAGVTAISSTCRNDEIGVAAGGGATGLGGRSFSSSSELILINSFSSLGLFLEKDNIALLLFK